MNKCDQDQLFDQRALQCVSGAQDQIGAIVERIDLHARRQSCLKRFDLLLHRIDHLERVDAVARDHDSANRLFAVAVERAGTKCAADLRAA